MPLYFSHALAVPGCRICCPLEIDLLPAARETSTGGNSVFVFTFFLCFSKAGITDVYEAHGGALTSLHFHPGPAEGSRDYSHLLLSSSVDWSIKLWSSKVRRRIVPALLHRGLVLPCRSMHDVPLPIVRVVMQSHCCYVSLCIPLLQNMGEPIASFEGADAYVYDVKWYVFMPCMALMAICRLKTCCSQ